MQVLVRVHTHQRASQAHGAQIPAIKLINEMQNCRGNMSCIADALRITAASQKKMPHSSRAGEGFRRVRIASIMPSCLPFAFTASTAIQASSFHRSCGVADKQDPFAPK